MEFTGVFLNEDIISNIFNSLDIRSMINFTHTSSYPYNNFHKNARYQIYKTINEDYQLFFELIRRYKYSIDELNQMGVIGVKHINIIWGDYSMRGYYDLRYLLEIIYKGMDIKNEEIITNVKDERILLMIKEIYNCKSFNRYETMLNINKKPLLTSLHVTFSPRNDEKLYYIENKSMNRFHGSVWIIN